MAVAWARAEVILDANGELLPAQVRREATRAGEEGGDAASKSFADSFRRSIVPRLNGMFAGVRNSLRRMGDASETTRLRFMYLGDAMRRLRFQFGNTTPMLRFRLAMMSIGEGAKDALGKVPGLLSKIGDGLDDNNQKLNLHASGWKNLSHNTRQWTLIIGAVIASMSELAVLGSAAGSGIFVLGGAIAGIIPGIGVLIWAMSVLSRDIEDLPESLQAARAGLTRFGEAWQKLGEEVAISVFTEAEGAFDSLADTVDALTPAFKSLGTVVGRVFKNFAKSIAPGTEAFENLAGFIEKSGPIFERVAGIVGKLGGGLLAAFNNPNFQRSISEMIGWVEDLFDTFDTFLRGPGFDEWLNHGRSVFGAFGGLLETVGELLNGMVTDETVGRLVTFIDNIDRFLATGGKGILDFAQELDVFGLLGEALATIGEALEPLAEPMANFAGAIHDVISSGIETLGPIIEDIADALAPFVQGLADFMGKDPKAIADALLVLAGAFVVFKGVQGISGAASAMQGFIGRMDDAVKKAPTWKSGLAGAMAGILSALPSFIDGEVSGQDIVGGLVSAITVGFAVGGPVGAAIAAGSLLVTTMIVDLTDAQHGPWNEGWDQIFDPANYTGAGIGPFKLWLQEEMLGVQTVWGGTWDGMNEKVNTTAPTIESGYGTMFTNIMTGLTNWSNGTLSGWSGTTTGMETTSANSQGVITSGYVVFYENMISGLTNFFIQAASNAVSGWASITGIFTSMAATLGGMWSGFWNSLPGAVSSGIATVLGILGGLWSSITGAFTSGLATAKGAWDGFWGGLAGVVRTAVNGVLGAVGALMGPVSAAIGAVSTLLGMQGSVKAGGGGAAAGTILYGPRRILAGEAGPEAIVPLNRALSQVDPSVRWLSAIAQGKGAPAMASGGMAGVGRQINVAEGAIVVQEAGDGRASANAVLTRLAEYANG